VRKPGKGARAESGDLRALTPATSRPEPKLRASLLEGRPPCRPPPTFSGENPRQLCFKRHRSVSRWLGWRRGALTALRVADRESPKTARLAGLNVAGLRRSSAVGHRASIGNFVRLPAQTRTLLRNVPTGTRDFRVSAPDRTTHSRRRDSAGKRRAFSNRRATTHAARCGCVWPRKTLRNRRCSRDSPDDFHASSW